MKKQVFWTLGFFAFLATTIMPANVNAQDLEYNNPIAEQRADPWIHKTDDGIYYFIATVPEYDRIEIRKSETINGITDAEPVVVWRKHETGIMGHHIWAPELHRIDGKWYIYFAAGEAEDIWNIRMYALSNDSEDPTTGKWVEEGHIKTQRGSFALDATTFEHKGERYMIWAEKVARDNNSGLIIAKMKDPVTLEGPEVVITKPDFFWEKRKYKVNEGASVLKRNGKIFVTYSASATNHFYAVGLLWADMDSDLMDQDSWTKSPAPVFTTQYQLDRYGPGHNGFTVAEDGKTDIMVYHARNYKDIDGPALEDHNRHTRVRVLHWNDEGWPEFRDAIED